MYQYSFLSNGSWCNFRTRRDTDLKMLCFQFIALHTETPVGMQTKRIVD